MEVRRGVALALGQPYLVRRRERCAAGHELHEVAGEDGQDAGDGLDVRRDLIRLGDADLAPAMEALGVALHGEATLDSLVDDLR